MNLAQLQIVARPRTPWQSMDLGIRLALQHYWQLLSGWLFLALPLFGLLLVFLPSWAALLVIWWLKPLFERWGLYYLSRAIFADAPPLTHIYRRWWFYSKPQLLPALSYRRLSWSRNFNLAVALLEQLSGSERRKRIEVLERRQPLFWSTIMLLHIELFIYSALLALLFLWQPEVDYDWGVFLNELISSVAYFMAYALIAPLFSAIGFVLYINRRVHLEGWDIQISFQKIAQRLSTFCLPWLLLMLLLPAPLTQAYTPADAKAEIEQLYEGEPVHRTKSYHIPKFMEDWEAFQEKELLAEEDDREPRTSSGPIAGIVEVILWGVLLVGVVYLAVFLFKNYQSQQSWLPKRSKKAVVRPKELFGLNVQSDSLPSDVISAVQHLLAEQQWREAIGLLYRASLIETVARFDVQFSHGDTEGDCVARVVQLSQPALSQFFTQLNKQWTLVAWAHRAPDLAKVEPLLSVWPALFAKVEVKHE